MVGMAQEPILFNFNLTVWNWNKVEFWEETKYSFDLSFKHRLKVFAVARETLVGAEVSGEPNKCINSLEQK